MSAGCSSSLVHLFQSIRQVLVDLSRLLLLNTKSRSALAAENLFLRKQLALFQERQVRPHLATDATRWLLVFLGKFFEWRRALVLVKPETLLRWHRKGFRLGIPTRCGRLRRAGRHTPENDNQRMGTPLQPGPASLLIRSWNSGAQPGQYSGQRPQTQAARRLPCCEDVCALAASS
jgi:hypothetical protein